MNAVATIGRLLAALLALALSACGETSTSSGTPVAIPTPTLGPTQAFDTGIPIPTRTPVAVPPGQLSADNVATTIADQWAAQTGGATAHVTCNRTGTFTSVAGDMFTCTFTDNTGRSGVITVTVGVGPGQYTWAVGTPPASPAVSPTATP